MLVLETVGSRSDPSFHLIIGGLTDVKASIWFKLVGINNNIVRRTGHSSKFHTKPNRGKGDV